MKTLALVLFLVVVLVGCAQASYKPAYYAQTHRACYAVLADGHTTELPCEFVQYMIAEKERKRNLNTRE